MKVTMRLFLVGLLLVVITGCVKKPPAVCSDAGLTVLTKTIESKAGGQYVELGDQVFIEVPAWYLFTGNSASPNKEGRKLLQRITNRLACYTTKAVRVTAYTGTLPMPIENRTLGEQRAKVVTDALLSNGVSRLIYQKSIAISNKCLFCRLNRIDIVTNQFH